MKKLLILLSIAAFIAACGTGAGSEVEPTGPPATTSATPAYDEKRGEGKFTNVKVDATLNATLAAQGDKVYGVKCSSCHKLTDEKLVGPGWKGVTARHTAEWIMNFTTNTDVMLDKDPKAQAQLEICLVRMPNQNLTDDDARSLYEFMRKNDGVK